MNKFGRRPPRWSAKLTNVAIRLIDIFRLMPLRLLRVGQHIAKGINGDQMLGLLAGLSWPRRLIWWITELFIKILELTGIGELYEVGSDLLKFRSRPLSQRELELARSVFGAAIQDYHRVRIDETAYLGPKQYRFCYVSFYLINSWGPMRDETLIHELVHVWQYEQIGAVYMPRALRAQRTPEGYNYGGVSTLLRALATGKQFFDFNLEQQGDIVADYFRLRQGYPPRWGEAESADLPVYQQFIDQLQKGLA